MKTLVNGVDASGIAALDRGLQYGDGLFETVAWRRGRLRLWPLHLERLAAGCARLRLPFPDPPVLERDIASAVEGENAVVKVIVTRGLSERGYRAPERAEPTRIVAAFPWPVRPPGREDGCMRVRTCRTRIGSSPSLAGLKHLGRLEQVLARSEWRDDSVEEGLMLDAAGRIVCATQANVFAVVRGALLTPRLDRAGVAGVMRRAVMEWASARGMIVRETALRPADLARADEVFLTSAILGARPVAEIDGNLQRQGTLAREFMAWLEAS